MATKKQATRKRAKQDQKDDSVLLDIRLPDEAVGFIERVRATGIVGNTVDDVVNHVMREHLLRLHLARQPITLTFGTGNVMIGTAVAEHVATKREAVMLSLTWNDEAQPPGTTVKTPPGMQDDVQLVFTRAEDLDAMQSAIDKARELAPWNRTAPSEPKAAKKRGKK